LLGLIWELYAIFDGNPHTCALTTWIVTYVPQWIFWTIFCLVVAWLVNHFKRYYRR